MAALTLGAISLPSSGAASSSALLLSNTTSSSKLIFTRSSRTRKVRSRTAITAAAYQVTLITPEGDKVVHVSKDECILDAAEKQGVVLPHNCRSGACSSCVGLLKSGTVIQDDQTFLDEEQLEAGFALMCTSYPTSDCVIETHQEDQFYSVRPSHGFSKALLNLNGTFEIQGILRSFASRQGPCSLS